MPTYQYACTACDHRFEAVQSFTETSLTECPACSGSLRKVFSSVGIVFKGSGFYRTDSRSGAGATVPKGESKTEGKSEGKSESGSSSTKDNGSSGNGSAKESSSSSSGSVGSASSSSSTPAKAAAS